MSTNVKVEVFYNVVSPLEFDDMITEEHNSFNTSEDTKRFIDKLRDDGVKDNDIIIYKNHITVYYNAEDFMNA